MMADASGVAGGAVECSYNLMSTSLMPILAANLRRNPSHIDTIKEIWYLLQFPLFLLSLQEAEQGKRLSEDYRSCQHIA